MTARLPIRTCSQQIGFQDFLDLSTLPIEKSAGHPVASHTIEKQNESNDEPDFPELCSAERLFAEGPFPERPISPRSFAQQVA